MSSDVRITTGQSSFDYGVDSSKVPLIQSAGNPNGLPNNAMSWCVNGTVRNGGVQQRYGDTPLCRVTAPGSLAAYQGGILYDNSAQGGNPYLMLSIGGRMIQVRVDTDNSVHDITGPFQDPPTVEKAYFVQGEQFMVKQAGDGLTLPLFWDGFTLRRSIGQNFNQGVTSAPFNVPAYGQSVLVTLTAPYTGPTNGNLQLWDASLGTPGFINFVQAIPGNFFLLQNVSGPPGLIIPAGTQVFLNGAVIGVLLAPYTTPAVGASLTAFITPSYTGPALPQNVQINGSGFQILFTGAGAPGANQVYLVSLNPQASGHPAGDTIPASTVMYANRELPAAQSMFYYMGRIWYSQNRRVTAGDIVDGPSGSVIYNETDSILKVTENPLAIAGDGFSVPTQAGNIRALNCPTALDQTLGEGPLFIFTEKQIYSLQVPISRTAWISASNTNQPLMAVVQKSNGTVSDRTVVAMNGDLFYQSIDPAIRTYQMGLRYFGTSWANPPISRNMNRILLFNNRALMHMAFGFEFNSRVYQGVLPVQTPVGVACTALAPLDTDPVSTLQNQMPPVWDGATSGWDILQSFSGSFGGLERAFHVVHSRIDGSIWVVEFTSSAQFDTNLNGNEVRVPMLIETPAFDWNEYPRSAGGGVFEAKELDGLDLWLDRIFGEVLVKVEFRPDEISCWYEWGQVKICAARTCAETVNNPSCYPVVADGELYRNPISFPKPTNPDCQPGNNRPVTIGYKFQLRITTLGWCRIRGFQLHAIRKDVAPFSSSICDDATSWMSTPPPATFPAPLPPHPVPPTPTPTPTGDVFGNPDTGEIFGDSSGNEFGVGP